MARIIKQLLCSATLLALSSTALAESVVCHVNYGGTTQLLEALPVSSPYRVSPVAIGSYFLFRIVFQKDPADLANIKLYVYADRDSGPVIIHQANYAYPLLNATVNGFSGLNYVYEPVRDGELQYWCETK
jgi:hypothetical protein